MKIKNAKVVPAKSVSGRRKRVFASLERSVITDLSVYIDMCLEKHTVPDHTAFLDTYPLLSVSESTQFELFLKIVRMSDPQEILTAVVTLLDYIITSMVNSVNVPSGYVSRLMKFVRTHLSNNLVPDIEVFLKKYPDLKTKKLGVPTFGAIVQNGDTREVLTAFVVLVEYGVVGLKKECS